MGWAAVLLCYLCLWLLYLCVCGTVYLFVVIVVVVIIIIVVIFFYFFCCCFFLHLFIFVSQTTTHLQ